MKKIILSIFMLISFSFSPVFANVDVVQEKERYTVIDSKVLYDKTNNEYYIFSTEEDLAVFLVGLNLSSLYSSRACLPGDPGYPHCTDKYVVKSTLQTYGNTKRTDLVYASNYMLGNNGWIYGPGTCSLTVGTTYTANFQFNDYVGLSVSIEVSGSYSFDVPKGKKGNIRYKGKFDITPKRYKYEYNDGTVTYGNVFYVTKLVNGTGGFASVLKAV